MGRPLVPCGLRERPSWARSLREPAEHDAAGALELEDLAPLGRERWTLRPEFEERVGGALVGRDAGDGDRDLFRAVVEVIGDPDDLDVAGHLVTGPERLRQVPETPEIPVGVALLLPVRLIVLPLGRPIEEHGFRRLGADDDAVGVGDELLPLRLVVQLARLALGLLRRRALPLRVTIALRLAAAVAPNISLSHDFIPLFWIELRTSWILYTSISKMSSTGVPEF